jgi:hypothetical protein
MSHRSAKKRPGKQIAGATILILCIACLSMMPVTDASRDTAAHAGNRVIISINPEQRSRVHWLLRSVLGQAKGEKFGLSRSEVWTVPASKLVGLAVQLRFLGSKLMRIPDDWYYLLRRQEGLTMSAAQDEMVKRTRNSLGCVGIGLMTAQQAALAEYALMTGMDIPAPAADTPPKMTISRVVIPISGTRQVTVQRAGVVTTEKGMIWRGTIAESGESALLMWWKNGHISGMFAYEGHIYAIVSAGGDVYAVVESDPDKMPPDHATPTSDAALTDDEGLSETSPDTASRPITPFSDEQRRALEAKQITIDLMMLYTKRAASHICRVSRT